MLLFAYGTLMDPDVRSLVLGRESPAGEGVAAVLPGYRRLTVAEEVYPTVLPHSDGQVEGLLVPLRSAIERERVQFFEGLELLLTERPVVCSRRGALTALVCTSAPTIRTVELAWDLTDWQRQHKDSYLIASRRYMDGFGRLDVTAVREAWIATGRGA
ncbi:MAG: hypothetical protein RLY86_2546 [Pseudomonadota bacterium]|jgi:hypothetical protein